MAAACAAPIKSCQAHPSLIARSAAGKGWGLWAVVPAGHLPTGPAPAVTLTTSRGKRRRTGVNKVQRPATRVPPRPLRSAPTRDPRRAKCVAGEAEPCSAALAGDRERSGGLRTCRRPSLLFRGRFAGERGRRCRQDFSLGRKPMLIGLTVYATMRGPDLVSALANEVFQVLIHVRGPA